MNKKDIMAYKCVAWKYTWQGAIHSMGAKISQLCTSSGFKYAYLFQTTISLHSNPVISQS